MALNTGQVLEERYQIDALLGQGGMGAVYRGTDLRFDTPVAIKENRMVTADSQRQFAREAGLLHRLRHPHLPRVTDHFSIAEQGQYLVMDYVDGEDLSQVLAQGEAISQAQALEWMGQVLGALEYLHSESIIHRDVKPANIRLTPEGHLFLVDFGLAKVYDSHQETTMGARGVTPNFAPPEQYGYGRTDARSDVYSCAATLYALLTGRQPADALDVMMGEAPFVAPSELNPAVSPEVERAILRAMQAKPADRYQSAGEFHEALLGAQVAPDTQTLDLSPRPVAQDWVQSARDLVRERPVLLLGAVALVLAIAAWVLLAPRGGAPSAPEPTEVHVAAAATTPPAEPPTPETMTRTPTATLKPTYTPSPTVPTPTVEAIETEPTETETPLEPSAPETLPRISESSDAETSSERITSEPPTLTPTPTRTAAAATTSKRNVDGMEMVKVPAGKFLMGATSADTDADAEEKPPHTVTLPAFWIDRTEVTNAQYVRFLNAVGGHKGACWGYDCLKTKGESSDSHIEKQDGQYRAETGYAKHPVVSVAWYGAAVYCEWAGQRLPTEAEWEKAARGTDGRLYPWGKTFSPKKANTCDKNCQAEPKKTNINDGYAGTAPVGSFPSGASTFGALDMAGNVWEWVADWYGEGYYSLSPARNPTGPSSGVQRVIRGGSYRFVPWYSRTTTREGDDPGAVFPGLGFRCASSTTP